MKQPNPMMTALCGILTKNHNATFAECRDHLAREGFDLFPISYGRAKALLGLVPTKKRGTGERATNGTRANSVPNVLRRGPGRPRKAANVGLDASLAEVRRVATEHTAMRTAFNKIFGILQDTVVR